MSREPGERRLDDLRRLTVRLGGTDRNVTLHPPTYDGVVRTLMEPADRDPRARLLLMGELVQILDLDGEPVGAKSAESIVDDPVALDAILAARTRLYAWLLEQGRAIAICPTCSAGTELDLAFYVSTLGMPPWTIADGQFIAAPTLAWPAPLPPPLGRLTGDYVLPIRITASRPPSPPRAARIDFALPSARVGLAEPGDAMAGTLEDVDHAREIEAWRRWLPAGVKQPTEHIHWHHDQPNFRAALRLAVALVDLHDSEGHPIEPTPEAIEQLFLADVQFLDLLYTATHDLPVEVPAPGELPRCTVRCANGHEYLPVR